MIKCPKCGSELLVKKEGSTIIVDCTKCSYIVATTSICSINEDETMYSIFLEKNNEINKDVVILIMNITGLNLTEVIDILKFQCPFKLLTSNAVEIKTISQKLKDKGVKYTIDPEFNW